MTKNIKKIPELIRLPACMIRDEFINYGRRYNAKNFVETGTHLGATCLHIAAYGHFNNIFSVELGKEYCSFLEKNFSQHAKKANIDVSNVKMWGGDSALMLPQMLDLLNDRCVFWLDAHISGGSTVGSRDYETPIIKELNVIAAHSIKDHVIIIDDIQGCFESNNSWPDIREVTDIIKSINKDYLITIKYGILFAEVPGVVHHPTAAELDAYYAKYMYEVSHSKDMTANQDENNA